MHAASPGGEGVADPALIETDSRSRAVLPGHPNQRYLDRYRRSTGIRHHSQNCANSSPAPPPRRPCDGHANAAREHRRLPGAVPSRPPRQHPFRFTVDVLGAVWVIPAADHDRGTGGRGHRQLAAKPAHTELLMPRRLRPHNVARLRERDKRVRVDELVVMTCRHHRPSHPKQHAMELGVQAQGPPCHPAATGEGKTGRVNANEPLMMPREIGLGDGMW